MKEHDMFCSRGFGISWLCNEMSVLYDAFARPLQVCEERPPFKALSQNCIYTVYYIITYCRKRVLSDRF